MADWNELVLVGRVARPHGIRGHVVVNSETDFVAERFRAGAEMRTRVKGHEKALRIADARVEGRRPILAFDGYDTVEAAEELAGVELRVPETDLQPLPAGTYYLHQLIGCRVDTTDGRTVGTVQRVEGGAGAAVLSIEAPSGEVLVPLAQEICVGIDIDARVIRVRMPEGLLELNETRRTTRGSQARKP